MNNPKDSGGEICKGVTLTTLTAWRKAPCSVDELKLIGDAEAGATFAAQYAISIRYDDLPIGVHYAIFNCSMSSGPGRAAKLLQQALGFAKADTDGVIGTKTMAAVKAADPIDLIGRYNVERLAFMETLRIWSTFGRSWTARVEGIGIQAHSHHRAWGTSVRQSHAHGFNGRIVCDCGQPSQFGTNRSRVHWRLYYPAPMAIRSARAETSSSILGMQQPSPTRDTAAHQQQTGCRAVS